MGENSAAEVDAWLRAGGIVVAASDRAARAATTAFHRARHGEGLNAWLAPNVLDWKTFAGSAWEQRATDGRLVLNTLQEESLWARVIQTSGHTAAWLEGPRRRLSASAMEAHTLLCAYAPRFLRSAARSNWQQDCAAFSTWLGAFDDICRTERLLSPSRLFLGLIPLLQGDSTPRPPLLLAGFDRLLPVQRAVFDAWGEWREIEMGETAHETLFFAAPDNHTELAACVAWCNREVAANPSARLLVVLQDASQRRGEIERAFLSHAQAARFEFSLGTSLGQTALARAALLLLRWLAEPLEEQEVDWLVGSPYAAGSEDSAGLQAHMRALRRRGVERTRWTLEAFLRTPAGSAALPERWVRRMTDAAQRAASAAGDARSPLAWAEMVPHWLEAMGWPGAPKLSSAEFQAARRWQQAVDLCGSLGFDDRRVSWKIFCAELDRTVDETLFAPESQDAPVLIAGPAESAGLSADAIWVLGADEDAWPARGSAHPLLPLDVQRDAGMPHATPKLDWELANAVTRRLLATAPVVRFSYARQKDGVETRPSRLIESLAGLPQSISSEFAPAPVPPPQTYRFEDFSRVPLRAASEPGSADTGVRGGSTVLTSQSRCPFQAFATARLGAQAWEPAQSGLTAAQRGQLLHAVLHAVWGAPPHGIRTLAELQSLADLRGFVHGHVDRVMAERVPVTVREQMPPRYLELESQRLVRLVTEWLEFEGTRLPFTVTATEREEVAEVAGLTLKLRLDRVDRLNDGSVLVVDYKTGHVSPRSWDLPRPDDVQLPLYAGFALGESVVGGLAFAKVRPADPCFAGYVGDAAGTLIPTLGGNSALVKSPFTAEMLIDWKEAIEQLARDFLAGRADVDPRDPSATCERCGLYTLCRVQEQPDGIACEDESTGGESFDE